MKSHKGPLGAGESQRIFPPPPAIPAQDAESLDLWGFKDTRFSINDRGNIRVTGNRYDGLSGEELPDLLPWFSAVIETPLSPQDVVASAYPTPVPTPRLSAAFEAGAAELLKPDQLETNPEIRLRHGHGHTVDEMHAVKHGQLARVPDYVVYPEDDTQVAALVALALRCDAVLIPYGGGTNVTDALRCPAGEARSIVSVDMSRMNRILWIDPVDRMACIQAGAVGRILASQLASYGFTLGHEPDSMEFSTLGGWIATNASGMKKARYGNIEDIVLDIHVATCSGALERTSVAPRESVGMDPKQWIIGSEGNLGIVTSAVVKLFPLPPVQRYGSILFKEFEQGLAFMYDLAQTGRAPASVRLMDNLQFQFGQVLKPAATGWKVLKKRFEKWLVTGPLGFDPSRMVACTLVFEGTPEDVAAQEKTVYTLAKRHGGFKAGEENGRRGYLLTYGIAYIRDFVMQHHVMAESFETSVPWSQAKALCDNVKRRVYEAHAERNLPGKPFVSCRVTQVYETGVCVYFYFAFHAKGVADPVKMYAEVEHAAREEILRCGGSLSHHHGVGKIRQSFIPSIMSPAAQQWRRLAKTAFDPSNVFGCGNLNPAATEEAPPT